MKTIAARTFCMLLLAACTFTDVAHLNALESKITVVLPDFCQVAEKTMPAVVSVKAQRLGKKDNFSQNESDDEAPFDPFQEDILRRFFGLPPQSQKPEKRTPSVAMGSGFAISADGFILTNNHVIDESSQITVTFTDGREYTAQLIGGDPNTDVALLKIDAKDIPYLAFADSDTLKIGEWVCAIGSPLGFQGSFTHGIVSAKGRTELDIIPIEEFIQTDAPINVGNSGGPLVNMEGQVVGMNAAIATTSGGSVGIGLTIPAKILQRVIDELQKHGKVVRGYIGVTPQKVDNDLAKLYGLPKAEGAIVTEVIENGPAAQAHVEFEDIILKVNGRTVDSPAGLRNIISLLQPGEKAELTIKRGEKLITLIVTIGLHPEQATQASDVQNTLGMIVQGLTPDLAKKLGYTEEKGVIIKYVTPNSTAQLAGLRHGQLIVSVNRKPCRTQEEFYQLIREYSADSQILLLVKDGSSTRFVILKMQ